MSTSLGKTRCTLKKPPRTPDGAYVKGVRNSLTRSVPMEFERIEQLADMATQFAFSFQQKVEDPIRNLRSVTGKIASAFSMLLRLGYLGSSWERRCCDRGSGCGTPIRIYDRVVLDDRNTDIISFGTTDFTNSCRNPRSEDAGPPKQFGYNSLTKARRSGAAPTRVNLF